MLAFRDELLAISARNKTNPCFVPIVARTFHAGFTTLEAQVGNYGDITLNFGRLGCVKIQWPGNDFWYAFEFPSGLKVSYTWQFQVWFQGNLLMAPKMKTWNRGLFLQIQEDLYDIARRVDIFRIWTLMCNVFYGHAPSWFAVLTRLANE